MLRSHYSADVGEREFGKQISIAGWVEDIRNLGGIAFILLRDKKGRTQITCIKKETPDIFEVTDGSSSREKWRFFHMQRHPSRWASLTR